LYADLTQQTFGLKEELVPKAKDTKQSIKVRNNLFKWAFL
jgi:hypothetical protein